MDPTFGNLTLIKLHTFCLNQVFSGGHYSSNYQEFDKKVMQCMDGVYTQYPYVLKGVEELYKEKLSELH